MDPVRDSVDVAIEFSQGHYSGRSAQRLFGQDVFPVCSPELLNGKNPLTTPADLRGHTLIHFDAPMDDPEWPNWETWLRANNVDRLDPNKGPHFTSPNFTTQALLAGHGVALMAELVVESELATGTLVKPFDISYPGDLSYWALATSVDSEDDPVTLFWSWLTREASRYVREKQMQSQSRPTVNKSPD
jgi:LysR family glycine cleavage system transcriptional activator